MIIEKPAWVHHDGSIFSMDLQPGEDGRCATAGSDHKVKIWNTKPILQDGQHLGIPKLLATLCDHCATVNCVRWSKSGIFLASGSDDNLVLIYEKKPGSGTVEFGLSEPANVENWKMLSTLRAHTGDVVDLAWSPDDTMLASCSMDNTVRIWKMPGGALISVLEGHTSLVKGVAWDPIGTFIASQSDDKTVIIWQTSNWSCFHKAEGSWKKTVGSTFFRRLSWSPCGHILVTTNGFQKPSHTAQVLERGQWSASFNFVGHNAPVVAVRVNHSLFRKERVPEGQEDDLQKYSPYNIIAIGSQDCNLTVWNTSIPRPIFVGKHFFTQSVVDLAWSPDGYSLFCCSLDGTIATFQFGVHELGYIVEDKELDDIRKKRYGDPRGRQAALAESPAQLSIEAAAAAKKTTPVKDSVKANGARNSSGVRNASEPEAAAAAPKTTPSTQVVVSNKPPPTTVRQKEYRQHDGRRRIIPEALPSEEAQAGEKRKLPADSRGDMPSKRAALASFPKPTEVTVERNPTTSTLIDVTRPTNVKNVDGVLSLQVRMPDDESGDLATPICLEAKKNSGETDLICSQGGEIKWRDRFAGKVTTLTGNLNFWAIGCEDGSLQVYSMAGRRAFPSMLVGSPAAFMDCNKDWELLLLTRGGTMHVWDLHQPACILNESLLPLLASTSGAAAKDSGIMKIISARFSQSGAPIVVLANGHAFLFHMKMRTWLRIADDTFPGSSFASSWPPPSNDGELATLQKGAAILGRPNFAWGRAVVNEKYQTRAHLEDQMASALALNSTDEYRQHLVAYTRFLAKEADEVRLREICDDLLGPLHASDISENSSRPTWEPYLVGMKKRELLKNEVLPAMASNRAIQRLLNEYLDLLSEYDISQPVQEEKHLQEDQREDEVQIQVQQQPQVQIREEQIHENQVQIHDQEQQPGNLKPTKELQNHVGSHQ